MQAKELAPLELQGSRVYHGSRPRPVDVPVNIGVQISSLMGIPVASPMELAILMGRPMGVM